MNERAWWGSAHIEQGQVRHWRVGPLYLWIQRLPGEWRVVHRSGDDPLETTLEVAVPTSLRDTETTDVDVLRVARRSTDDRIELTPLLADRPIVSRPSEPFRVLPGEKVDLFVSSPVWLRLGVDQPESALCEFPTFRPSDTWVGPTTRMGELAYAIRTHCRMHVDDLPFRPHRATTPVRVRNRSTQPLMLERIGVAVPNLSLYASEDDRLWTERITITREDGEAPIEVRIEEGPPDAAPNCTLLAPPRKEPQSNRLLRAVEALL